MVYHSGLKEIETKSQVVILNFFWLLHQVIPDVLAKLWYSLRHVR